MGVKDFLGQPHNRFFGRIQPGQKLAGGHSRSGQKADKPKNFQSHIFFSQEALQGRINYMPNLVNAPAAWPAAPLVRGAGMDLFCGLRGLRRPVPLAPPLTAGRVRLSGLTLLFICTGVISIFPSPVFLSGPANLQF